MLILNFAKILDYNRAGKPQRLVCQELAGLTLGLVGFGASARELAQRAWSLGMRIMAIDIVEFPQAVLNKYHVEFFGKPAQLDRVLAAADYLSLHLHLHAKTRKMIDERALDLMKPSAVLINVARGGLVDEAALSEALQTRRIRGAGLDVFKDEPPDPAHPMLQMDNVIATAHTAAYTLETEQRRSAHAAENVARLAQGLPPLDLVMSLFL